eukprot:m.26273 g.26273  ORF g.26273 m.26273 type:complete len:274 (+) comp8809_c1_seq1:93-914(+)
MGLAKTCIETANTRFFWRLCTRNGHFPQRLPNIAYTMAFQLDDRESIPLTQDELLLRLPEDGLGDDGIVLDSLLQQPQHRFRASGAYKRAHSSHVVGSARPMASRGARRERRHTIVLCDLDEDVLEDVLEADVRHELSEVSDGSPARQRHCARWQGGSAMHHPAQEDSQEDSQLDDSQAEYGMTSMSNTPFDRYQNQTDNLEDKQQQQQISEQQQQQMCMQARMDTAGSSTSMASSLDIRRASTSALSPTRQRSALASAHTTLSLPFSLLSNN